MTRCISDFIVKGELNNTKRNTVYGWLDFGDEWGIRIGLTGNMAGELAGKHIRFSVPFVRPRDAKETRDLERMVSEQVGAVGEVSLKNERSNVGSEKNGQSDSQTISDGKSGQVLTFEWFSQNGHVIAEIPNPIIELVPEGDFLKNVVSPLDLLELPPIDYEDEVGFEGISDQGSGVEEYPTTPRPELTKKSWHEILAGLDATTRALFESWHMELDEARYEPVSMLFDPPIKLPLPSNVRTDQHAQKLLKTILTQLATYSVAIDICEHCSAMQAYRILFEDILPDATVHPDLTNMGVVQHFSTWETCPECEEEFEAEFGESEEDLLQEIDDDNPDFDFDQDAPF